MTRIDLAFLAEPLEDGVPTYSGILLGTLDYAFLAQPFCITAYQQQEIITTGNIKRILKVDWPYVKTIINVEG